MSTASIEKRRLEDNESIYNETYNKKPKSTALTISNNSNNNNALIISSSNNNQNKKILTRTSTLLSPTMLLEGHQSYVYSCMFNHSGLLLASGSYDKTILIWNIYSNNTECKLSGHNGAILDVTWNYNSEKLFTASTDYTAGIYDMITNTRIKRIKDHKLYVNTCKPCNNNEYLFSTGSDDTTSKLYDTRYKKCIKTFECEYPVLSVAWSSDNTHLFTAGIDNNIRVWDIRKTGVYDILEGHTDSVTGISMSPTGEYLLSNSMDQTARIWDLRPYAPQKCINVLTGHSHNYEKNMLRCDWNKAGTKVSAGSSDKLVYIWDSKTGKLIYKLPGHSGAVNQVCFSPKEPIIASCSNDNKIYLGEYTE